MDGDAPTVFDAATLQTVAAIHDIEERALGSDLATVQAVVADFGALTVDDVVYEWRTQFHEDPLVGQTPEAYYLDVRPHVWTDVVERAGADLGAVDAVRAAHAAQFDADQPGDPPGGAMVLAKG